MESDESGRKALRRAHRGLSVTDENAKPEFPETVPLGGSLHLTTRDSGVYAIEPKKQAKTVKYAPGELKDEETGQFKKGNVGGPGRPRGSYNLMKTFRKYAKREGLDVEQLIFDVVEAMGESGKEGDSKAAKLFLERTCGQLEAPAPSVNVQVNNAPGAPGATGAGPQIPSGGFGDYLTKLQGIAVEQKLITAAELPDVAPDDLDEMLEEFS